MSTISEAHAGAARTNGAKSQGPATGLGKSRSSQNATTHGLTAKHLIVEPDEVEEHQLFVTGNLEWLKPVGPVEESLVERMIDAAWNLRRVRILEVRLKEKAGEDPLIATDPFIYKQGTALIRYKLNHDRLYYKAWNELQSLQKQRLQQEAQAQDFAAEEFAADEAEDSSTKRTQSYGQAVLERLVEKAKADEQKAQAARNDIDPASVRQ